MGAFSTLFFVFSTLLLVICSNGEDPYRIYTWNVTYGDIYPLGVKQQVWKVQSYMRLFEDFLSNFFILAWSQTWFIK